MEVWKYVSMIVENKSLKVLKSGRRFIHEKGQIKKQYRTETKYLEHYPERKQVN